MVQKLYLQLISGSNTLTHTAVFGDDQARKTHIVGACADCFELSLREATHEPTVNWCQKKSE